MPWEYWPSDGSPTWMDYNSVSYEMMRELVAAFDERAKEMWGPDAYVRLGDTTGARFRQPQWERYRPGFAAIKDNPFDVVNYLLEWGNWLRSENATLEIRPYTDGGWTTGGGFVLGEFWEDCGLTEAEYNEHRATFGGLRMPSYKAFRALRNAATQMRSLAFGYYISGTFNLYFTGLSGIESVVGTGSIGTFTPYIDIYRQGLARTRFEVSYDFAVGSAMRNAGSQAFFKIECTTITNASAYTLNEPLVIDIDGGSYTGAIRFPNVATPFTTSPTVTTILQAGLVGPSAFNAAPWNYATGGGPETLQARLGVANGSGVYWAAFHPAFTYP